LKSGKKVSGLPAAASKYHASLCSRFAVYIAFKGWAKPLHTIAFRSFVASLHSCGAVMVLRCLRSPLSGPLYRPLLRLCYSASPTCISFRCSAQGVPPNPSHKSNSQASLIIRSTSPLHFGATLHIRFWPCSARRASSILCAPPAGHLSAAPVQSGCKPLLAKAALRHSH